MHRIDIEGASNPYGTIFGGRIGAGVRARLRRVTVRLEVAAHPILSDFGTSEEFLIGSYRPIGVVVGF